MNLNHFTMSRIDIIELHDALTQRLLEYVNFQKSIDDVVINGQFVAGVLSGIPRQEILSNPLKIYEFYTEAGIEDLERPIIFNLSN